MAAAGKAKTHKGAKKRFRVAGKRIRCRAAFRSHGLAKQNTKRRKHKIGGQVVNKADQSRVKSMLQEI